MRIAAVQTTIEWLNPAANFEWFAGRVAEAAAQGADLVVLPETFSTGFAFGQDGLAIEPFGGPSSAFLSQQATTHQVWVAGSCPERGEDGGELPYNSFIFAAPDGSQHRYRKVHPFSFAGEDHHVRPGTELVAVRVGDVDVAPFVCYDLRFATEFWSMAADVQLYLVVANWPASRREHWRSLLRARAIENLAYVVGVNRIGAGGGLDYSGDTMVIGPDGSIIEDASDRDIVVAANIDPYEVSDVRRRFGFLADRRFVPTAWQPGDSAR